MKVWRHEGLKVFLKDSFTLNSGSTWALDTNTGEIQLIEENTEKMRVQGGVDWTTVCLELVGPLPLEMC